MGAYLVRRLLLIPITLFCILLVNFVIINLAPGDPVTVTERSPNGAASRSQGRSFAGGGDLRWLQFREHYGLTLPILINLWPWTTQETVNSDLIKLAHPEKMSPRAFDDFRIKFGDKSRFIMDKLLVAMQNPSVAPLALLLFVRGGIRQAVLGSNLTEAQNHYNQQVAKDNSFLQQMADGPVTEDKIQTLTKWYQENKEFYHFDIQGFQKVKILFQTRFFRYFKQVLTLDFGTLRNDTTKTVISEVTKRFKYSLTLSLIPMVVTFFLCQIFGLLMTVWHNRAIDYSLNVFFLILYAIPVFVAAPLLIEKVAIPNLIPYSGFSSPEAEFLQMNSFERLKDISIHIFLPLVAIMYGSLAASARLSRTAFLEVCRQDYIRTAKAKGVHPLTLWVKHVGRNGGIPILTSLAGSLGVVLGGALIIEILFEINGFGKFFYDAVINRDYNVILFSAIAGSFLSLLGYLAADIAYTLLDPRITLE
jgi:peptide/nickel transport system permease protein